MAHDDQFTAQGPANSGSGFPFTAFSTKASDMRYGVNLQATEVGVYAEGGTDISGTPERSFIVGTGV
jgi:hypothetical protein